MLLLTALKNKSISLLWAGQVCSNIGDEIYRVSLVWLAIGFIGPDTGYLAATQSSAMLVVSLFGGKWSDHWDHYRTMLWVDILRAICILFPVIYHFYFPLSLPVLWITSILIAALTGFFDPSLQAVLPRYCANRREVQAATGLISTTLRLSRVVAPMIIGVLTAVIPIIHFFTIDSLTFIASAVSIALLMRHPVKSAYQAPPPVKHGIFQSLLHSYKTLKRHHGLHLAWIMKSLMAGAWYLGYMLGIALLVKQKMAGNLGAYGWVMGGYGFGNIVGSLYFGNRERKRPELQMYLAFLILGTGFILMAISPSLPYMVAAAALTAISGPMNDIPYTDLMQENFRMHELPKLIRLRLAGETATGLLGFLIGPFLFRVYGPSAILISLGCFILLVAFSGGWISKAWKYHAHTHSLPSNSP